MVSEKAIPAMYQSQVDVRWIASQTHSFQKRSPTGSYACFPRFYTNELLRNWVKSSNFAPVFEKGISLFYSTVHEYLSH